MRKHWVEERVLFEARLPFADEREKKKDHDRKAVGVVSPRTGPVLIDRFVVLSNVVAAHAWFCNIQPVHGDDLFCLL
jgi:hypothetical protein